MAPPKKAQEPSAPPALTLDAGQPRPSLNDVSFIQQLLQLAHQAAAQGVTGQPFAEDGDNSNTRYGSRCVSPTPPLLSSGSPSQPSLPASARGTSGTNTNSAAAPAAVAEVARMPLSPSVQLQALTGRALYAEEDYWTDLRKQFEVDEVVSFLRFSAEQGHTALKTQHVLFWLRAYKDLVESRREADDTVPERLLPQLSTGKKTSVSGHVGSADSATSKKAQRRTSGNSSSHARSPGSASRRKSSCASNTEKRSADSAGRASFVAAAGEEDGKGGAPPTEPSTESRVPYEEALRQALTAFLTNEVEMGWRWEQVPRQPLHGLSSSATGAPSSGSAKKKPSRSERARQQQQQQQELEEEQRRLAAAAALPPENIYLKANEVSAYMEPFVRRGLLQHAALYEYLARHPTQSVPADGPQVLSLVLEQPVIPPFLDSAQSFLHDDPRYTVHAGVSAGEEAHRAAPPGPGQATAATQSTKGNSARGSTTTTPRGGVAGNNARGAGGKEGRHAGGEAAQPTRPSTATIEVTAVKAPLEVLRAEQEKEMAALTRSHAEAVAAAAHHAKVAETQRAMELTFENREGTTKAVSDVYEEVEREVQERQARILQRVTALEVSLGLRPDPRAEESASVSPPVSASATRETSAQPKTSAKRK